MKTIVSILSILFFLNLHSQDFAPVTGRLTIWNSDTFFLLPQITVESDLVLPKKISREQWTRLKYNVKKVYPYAILASAKLKEYEFHLSTLPESQRKDHMKIAEKDLQSQFGEELKKLSMNQGRILIKLIDRETGRTSYDLVKQLRGSFSAFMWQGVARLFGSNLKSEYDSAGEDYLIEVAIRQIELGYL